MLDIPYQLYIKYLNKNRVQNNTLFTRPLMSYNHSLPCDCRQFMCGGGDVLRKHMIRTPYQWIRDEFVKVATI